MWACVCVCVRVWVHALCHQWRLCATSACSHGMGSSKDLKCIQQYFRCWVCSTICFLCVSVRVMCVIAVMLFLYVEVGQCTACAGSGYTACHSGLLAQSAQCSHLCDYGIGTFSCAICLLWMETPPFQCGNEWWLECTFGTNLPSPGFRHVCRSTKEHQIANPYPCIALQNAVHVLYCAMSVLGSSVH